MQNAHAKAMLAAWFHACMQPISEAFNFIYIDIKKLQQVNLKYVWYQNVNL